MVFVWMWFVRVCGGCCRRTLVVVVVVVVGGLFVEHNCLVLDYTASNRLHHLHQRGCHKGVRGVCVTRVLVGVSEGYYRCWTTLRAIACTTWQKKQVSFK